MKRYLWWALIDSAEAHCAREFGMVRGDKAILYRFGDGPDTAKRK
jgi:hypothetical protein